MNALDALRGSLIDWQLAEVGMSEQRQRFHALRDRKTNGLAPRAVSSFNLFQTPTALAFRMVQLAGVANGDNILEPSAGLGRLVSPTLNAAHGVRLTAMDSSPACCSELRLSFPLITVKQADFLALSPVAEFDIVLANPPFSMKSDIKHILHALNFLKPCGVLVAICMAGQAREQSLRPLANLWEPLPAGTFREAGTSVDAVLLRIVKKS